MHIDVDVCVKRPYWAQGISMRACGKTTYPTYPPEVTRQLVSITTTNRRNAIKVLWRKGDSGTIAIILAFHVARIGGRDRVSRVVAFVVLVGWVCLRRSRTSS